jgi:hypothetical protein
VRDEVRVEEVRDEEMKGELHVFDEFRDGSSVGAVCWVFSSG